MFFDFDSACAEEILVRQGMISLLVDSFEKIPMAATAAVTARRPMTGLYALFIVCAACAPIGSRVRLPLRRNHMWRQHDYSAGGSHNPALQFSSGHDIANVTDLAGRLFIQSRDGLAWRGWN